MHIFSPIHEALVMTHQYHGFNLLHRIEGNTNNDEECRTAKVDAGDSRQPHDDVWHHRNEGEEYGPCKVILFMILSR